MVVPVGAPLWRRQPRALPGWRPSLRASPRLVHRFSGRRRSPPRRLWLRPGRPCRLLSMRAACPVLASRAGDRTHRRPTALAARKADVGRRLSWRSVSSPAVRTVKRLFRRRSPRRPVASAPLIRQYAFRILGRIRRRRPERSAMHGRTLQSLRRQKAGLPSSPCSFSPCSWPWHTPPTTPRVPPLRISNCNIAGHAGGRPTCWPATGYLSRANQVRLTWAFIMERVTRIELALSAWEADVLPLNYTRVIEDHTRSRPREAPGAGSACPAALPDQVAGIRARSHARCSTRASGRSSSRRAGVRSCRCRTGARHRRRRG